MARSNPLDFTVKIHELTFSRVKGQAAGIRFFDEDSRDDFKALKDIMESKEVKEWMDDTGKFTLSDYEYWAGKHTHNSFLFAIHDSRLVTYKKIREIRGFVNVYSETSEKFRVKRMIKNGVFPASFADKKVLEVSMAARPSKSNLAGSGLISSALRQACLQVRYILKEIPQDDLKIMAFVDPENAPSVRAVEASGFEMLGSSKYDSDSEEVKSVYVLNWDWLEAKVSKMASGKVILEPQITDSHCGAAVTKALLHNLEVEVNQDDVVRAAEAESRLEEHGLRPSHIAKALEKLAPGVALWFKEDATLTDLNWLVNKLNLPVVVNWQSLFYDTIEEESVKSPNDDHGHYSIVVGVKLKNRVLQIDDPYIDYFHMPRIIEFKWFLKRWWDADKEIDSVTKVEDNYRTDKLLFVIVPKDYVFEESLGMKKINE